MSIIDDLKISTDETTVNRYHQLRRAGRLSEAQIRYAEDLIAKGGDAEAKAEVVARIAASRPGGALYEAKKAEAASKAAPKAQSARQAKMQAEYEAWVAAGRPAK